MKKSSAERLEQLVMNEWLPAWIAKKRLGKNAKFSGPAIDEEIATSVLRALDKGRVTSNGTGGFELPSGGSKVGIFWHGARAAKPRHVYFAYEGLITVAAVDELARLGWAPRQMRFEAIKWAFDLGVLDEPSGRLLIACESKRTEHDVDKLIAQIQQCGRAGRHAKASCPRAKSGHPKYQGIISADPELFWAVAPGHRPLFSVMSLGEGFLNLVPVQDVGVLARPRRRSTAR